MDLIQQVTSTTWGLGAAIVILGLCIFFHEAGHFLAAKWCRMRVEAFALGLGPPAFGVRVGETYYSVNWIPFGGYVKIAGMEPGEANAERGFYSRPRWMGALTIFAGVFMNLVLAVLLFTLVTYVQGVPVPGAPGNVIANVFPGSPASQSDLQEGDQIVALDGSRRGMTVLEVAPNSLAARLGLKPGDRVLQVGERLVAVPLELAARLAEGQGKPQRLVYADSAATDFSNTVRTVTITAPLPGADPASLTPSAAESLLRERLGLTFAPLQQTDIVTYTSLRPQQTIRLTVLREGSEKEVAVNTEVAEARLMHVAANGRVDMPHTKIGRMGVALTTPTQRVGLGKSLVYGAVGSVEAVAIVIDSLHALFSRKVAATPGGPVSIIAMTYEQARLGWAAVASFGGLLSANLAVFNLLPVPPLDGFVLLLLGFEGLIRRRIDARAEYLVKVAGFVILMGLIVSLTFNDVANLILHGTP